ncbi:MAG: hypothetical protein ACYC99_05125 [Candidatus Geothermincolia bacterium]
MNEMKQDAPSDGTYEIRSRTFLIMMILLPLAAFIVAMFLVTVIIYSKSSWWILVIAAIVVFFGLCVALPVFEIRSMRGSIALEGDTLEPGSFDEHKFEMFSNALEAVSLGAGVKGQRVIVVDTPAPLAYLAISEGHSVQAISKELLELDFTGAEIEAVVADLLAKSIVNTASSLRGEARELAVPPAVMDEIRRHYENMRFDYLIFVLADTLAVRITGQPSALKSAIVKCANKLDERKVRLRDMDESSWCQILVAPPLDGWNGFWSRRWKEIVKLRVDNLEMIQAGRWHPGVAMMDWMPNLLEIRNHE